MTMMVGDLIRSKFRNEYVSIWGSPDYVNYLGEFGPTQVGIILGRDDTHDVYRDDTHDVYRILINGKCGWIFETFLERI